MRMRRFIRRRFVTGFHRGQKGFTLIELLIVVVILGILAGVLVPRLISFLGTGNVAAANQEVASVETASLAYYADNGVWPTDCTTADVSLTDPPGTAASYLSKVPKYYNYPIGQTTDGKVDDVAMTGKTSIVGSLKWDPANHKWIKQ